MHNASQVVMGQTGSNIKEVSNKKGEIAAGLIVRLKSDDTISIAAADGAPLGVSLGKDLSNIGYTAVCREGVDVPILLTAAFTPTIGAQVAISDTTGKACAYTGSGDSYVNAVYKSAVLTGLLEDDTTADVALIDFVGGL